MWLSLTATPPDIGFDMDEGDKYEHVLAYGSLMLWFCLLYARLGTRLGYAALWVAMGVVLEIMQGHLGYRSYDVYDMAANTVGVAAGWALSFAMPGWIARKLR